jgi:hypothetical protein
MTTQYADVPPQEHEHVLKLLPWYSEGTLTPDQSARTEKHLEICPVCRVALERDRFLRTTFAARGATDAWQPSEAHFERLRAVIDVAEQENLRVQPSKKAWKWRFGLDVLRTWLGNVPTALRWALGVETLVLMALMLALAIPRLPETVGEGQAFKTLSSVAKSPASARGPRLHVVFAGDMTETEIHSLLQAIHGQLVEGPSAVGAYTVELPAVDAESEALDQAVKTLRANAKVWLAEPVPNPVTP